MGTKITDTTVQETIHMIFFQRIPVKFLRTVTVHQPQRALNESFTNL